MGFLDKVVSVGTSMIETGQKNLEREQQKIRREMDNESRYARGKSDSELKAQVRDKDNSHISRYAAKTELERRGYGK